MKKFVFLCIALVAFATMQAQQITTKPTNSPMLLRSQQSVPAMSLPLVSKPEAVNLCGEPVSMTMRPRRAAAMPDTYYGVGLSNAGQQVSWTMTVSKDAEGVYTFSNIGPVPASWSSIVSAFVVTGTQIGDKVVVEPQITQLQSASYDVWFCNYASSANAGRIEFTVNDDGSLTLDPGTVLCYYGVAHGKSFDPTFSDRTVMLNYVYYFTDISYTFDVPVLNACAAFEPDFMYLHASYGYIGYGLNRNYCIIPAYADIPFKNNSLYADSYHWSVNEVAFNFDTNEYDAVIETMTGDEEDFEFTSFGTRIYSAVSLNASNDNGTSTYTWGTQFQTKPVVAYAGELASYFNFSDGSQPIVGCGNPDFGLAYHSDFATPDKSPNNITELILYQGKCVSPLYCEGINLLVHQFEQKDGFNLKCSIYEASRDDNGRLTLGSLIAESSKVSVYANEERKDDYAELRWTDFYVHGRYGDMVQRDFMFIEDECAIVISGWNNGTFSAIPFGESYQNENGLPFTYVRLEGKDAIMTYSNNYRKMYAGFYNAVYGYLISPGGTDVKFSANGGGVATTIYPLLTNGYTGTVTTRIFRDDDYEVPSWLQIGVLNESYDDFENMHFDLAFIAEPLPDDVDVRSCELLLWQEGAKLLFTITQDRNYESGVNVVDAEVRSEQMYNLSGQCIKDSRYKGIIIQGGKKIVK